MEYGGRLIPLCTVDNRYNACRYSTQPKLRAEYPTDKGTGLYLNGGLLQKISRVFWVLKSTDVISGDYRVRPFGGVISDLLGNETVQQDARDAARH